LDDRRGDGGTNFILRIKEQETRLTPHEHDDDDVCDLVEMRACMLGTLYKWWIQPLYVVSWEAVLSVKETSLRSVLALKRLIVWFQRCDHSDSSTSLHVKWRLLGDPLKLSAVCGHRLMGELYVNVLETPRWSSCPGMEDAGYGICF